VAKSRDHDGRRCLEVIDDSIAGVVTSVPVAPVPTTEGSNNDDVVAIGTAFGEATTKAAAFGTALDDTNAAAREKKKKQEFIGRRNELNGNAQDWRLRYTSIFGTCQAAASRW